MKALRINREFAMRHLGVAVVMLGLSGWFGYDGFVNYPRQDESFFEERHLVKASAIERQKEFMGLALIAALVIAGRLFAISRFRCEFDEKGFTVDGKRHEFAAAKEPDRKLWDKKDIIVIDGIKLDAWHHNGVKELVEAFDRAREGVVS